MIGDSLYLLAQKLHGVVDFSLSQLRLMQQISLIFKGSISNNACIMVVKRVAMVPLLSFKIVVNVNNTINSSLR